MSEQDLPPSQNETAGALASLKLLYEIGREVTADLDLHTLLNRVLFLAMKNVGAVSGSIIALDENGQPGESAFLMHGGANDGRTGLQLKVTYERGMAGWVARNRQAVLIEDTSKDDRWLRRPDDAEDRTGAKSAVSAPIMTHNRIVGVITLVHPRVGFFREAHVQLIEAIADWAGAAIRRAQLVANLQAANQRYRQLFDDSIDPILITDWQGHVHESNRTAQAMIGVEPADMNSLDIKHLHVLEARKLKETVEQVKTGTTLNFESRLRTFHGSDVPVQVYVRSVNYGGASQLQWILRDITERKDLDRLREDLIAMVYHDLRSPLSNIVSSMEVLEGLLDEGPTSETALSLIQIAARSAARIQGLTESLLDINRMEAGQVLGKRRPISLAELGQEAIEAVTPNAAEKNMHLVYSPAEDLPQAMADPDMIRRVLINLLENAIKYARKDGIIQLNFQRKGEILETSVQDDGPGISPADQERIFDKFTRLRSTEGPRGLGLGLAYCRLAVNAHGGKIWVESQVGQGANFKFTLPVAPSTNP
jgi:PAS domain S-box-containing protein